MPHPSTTKRLTAAQRSPVAARAPADGPVAPACACGRLRRAARALTQLYDDAMAPSGLRITQFSLLRTVARDGKARISDLAATLLLDRTALSRNLDPLLARGLLAVTPGRDARTREVALTSAGARALKSTMPCWNRAQAEVAKRLGGDKLEALIATLAEVESLHPLSKRKPKRIGQPERLR